MPRYLFQLLDGTGANATELEHDCDTFDDARSNAKEHDVCRNFRR